MTSKIRDLIIIVCILISLTFTCASDVLEADVKSAGLSHIFRGKEATDFTQSVKNKAPCTNDSDCVYGFCRSNDDKQKFCQCFNGTSGDKCQLIDDCESKKLDCGKDPKIKCLYAGGRFGQAYCACPDKNLKFSYDSKTCIDCRCGDYALGCAIRNNTKECVCGYQTGDKDGRCVECDCTSNYLGCIFNIRNERGYNCICREGYSDLFYECTECDCGPHQIDCMYHRGGPVCRCKEGFAEKNRYCQDMCNNTHTCQNGGECVEQVCRCKDGTDGYFCEKLSACRSWGSCGDHESVMCDYNQNTTKTTCVCKDKSLAFDNEQKVCRECDCGPNGNCSFWYGKKCKCDEGYSEFRGTCKPCRCKGGVCSFSTEGQRICSCDYRSMEVNEECLECDCGRGLCSYNGTQKICFCNSGYVEYYGKCKYCYCGSYGTCSINNYGSTVCYCAPGYGENNGYCQECECGRGANCTFYSDGKKCICPEYYEEKNKTCVLIEDCNKPNACPVTTKCVERKEGGYECVCAEGFSPVFDRYTGLQDPHKVGCREICLPGDCNAGKCNITGNIYECICDEGYGGKYCDIKVLKIPGNSGLIAGFSVSMLILGAVLFASACMLFRYFKNVQSASADGNQQQNLAHF
ncbi:Tenascin-X, partial [Stegodyphus mimosarum]